MRTYVIGDVHGAGLELDALLRQINPGTSDQVLLVGDVFDRGLHAAHVWSLLRSGYITDVFLGNHEHKIQKWLQGRRDWLVQYYYVALNALVEAGVNPDELLKWLLERPLLRDYGDFIVTHAAVDVNDPLRVDEGVNLYGSPYNDRKYAGRQWWDDYQGDKVVYYGHLVTGDNLPRIRRNAAGRVNSVGLDTAACHGGNLTCICVETGEFYSYRSGIDWGKQVEEQMKVKPPVVNPDLMKWVVSQRERERARLEGMKGSKSVLVSGTS